jgi:hypothetical protein
VSKQDADGFIEVQVERLNSDAIRGAASQMERIPQVVVVRLDVAKPKGQDWQTWTPQQWAEWERNRGGPRMPKSRRAKAKMKGRRRRG